MESASANYGRLAYFSFVRPYLWLVSSLAIAALVLTARAGPPAEQPDLTVACTLLLLGIAAQHFPLEIGPQHKTDLALAVYVAAFLSLPPAAAVVVAGLSHALGQMTLALRRNPANGRRRRGARGILFNTAQIVLAVWLASAIYGAFAPAPVLATVLAGVALYATNFTAVQTMLVVQHGLSKIGTIVPELMRQLPEFAALCLIGVVSALASRQASMAPWLLVLPTAAVYYTQRRSLQSMTAEQRARIEAERARAHLRLLANASLQLANSLDCETTLQIAVRLAVPDLADWCLLSTQGSSDDSGPSRTISYLRPDLGPDAQRLQAKYPFDPHTAHGLRRVMDTAQAELCPEVPDALLESAARDAEHLRLLRGMGLKCALLIPLVAGDRRIGAISYYSADPQRQYGHDDLRLAQELAARCALSIEHARMYEEQVGAVAHLRQLSERLGAAERDQLLTDERHRIAYELHDRVQQAFFGIGLAVGPLLGRTDSSDGHGLHASLGQVRRLATQGADDLRGAIFALTRAEIQDRGLVRTLWYLVRRFETGKDLAADLVVAGAERPIEPEIAEVLHAVARECLANVEQHAAASVVIVSLRFEPDAVTLTVQDDGVGASPLVLNALTDSAIRFGLRGIHERVSRVGGAFTTARGDDGGFLARARIPTPPVDGPA